MTTIQISDLQPAGYNRSDLSYLGELRDVDISKIQGGGIDQRETFVCGSLSLVAGVLFTPVIGVATGLFCTLFAAEID